MVKVLQSRVWETLNPELQKVRSTSSAELDLLTPVLDVTLGPHFWTSLLASLLASLSDIPLKHQFLMSLLDIFFGHPFWEAGWHRQQTDTRTLQLMDWIGRFSENGDTHSVSYSKLVSWLIALFRSYGNELLWVANWWILPINGDSVNTVCH